MELKSKVKKIHSLLVNARNANCFTGKQGYKSLEKIAELLSQKLSERQLEDEEYPKRLSQRKLFLVVQEPLEKLFQRIK